MDIYEYGQKFTDIEGGNSSQGLVTYFLLSSLSSLLLIGVPVDDSDMIVRMIVDDDDDDVQGSTPGHRYSQLAEPSP